MFQIRKRETTFRKVLTFCELVYHNIVRTIRKTHGNALMSIAMNLMQMIIFVLAFYFMFSILGLRGAVLRGDFMVYIMTGIFLFMTHIKTVAAVSGSEGPASPMMKHAPMNTSISIAAAALSQLYIQMLSLVVIMFAYHVLVTPFEIQSVTGVMFMILLAWFTAVAVGMVFLAIKPWSPGFSSLLSTIYQRANMIASGKMFVANTLTPQLLNMFDWNPLFHCIDQSRGYAFVNYSPRNSSWEYAFYVGVIFLMIGMMGEFYTRKHASASWSARQ
ncbi:MAG: ABC transporter permease [Planktotalea sp.]|uniref:ABC transporter permease n=1 Tax=Planktotalea sp. TaxID=2029877 RepID=UPI003C72B6D7